MSNLKRIGTCVHPDVIAELKQLANFYTKVSISGRKASVAQIVRKAVYDFLARQDLPGKGLSEYGKRHFTHLVKEQDKYIGEVKK